MTKKTGRLALVLPGNTFHSNLLPNRWEEMYKAQAGLNEIGRSGVPVTVSYQGIDFSILPWLKETLAQYPSIEVLNAPHSHSLIPLMPKKMAEWELESKIPGSIDCSFFAEFYAPKAKLIPTKFFLALEGASYLYSACCENWMSDVNVEQFDSPRPLALDCDGKIGILMSESRFKPLLDAFFRFQRDPVTIDASTNGKEPLENVLDQIEAIGESGEIVVCPIDIEAPFVGSALGARVWERLFQGIKRRGLSDICVHLSDLFDEMEKNAVPSPVPERILTKWTVFRVQVNYLTGLAKFKPHDKANCLLLSIASCSDILSAFERKIGESQKKILLSGRNETGEAIKMPISFNQEIIDVQLAAVSALNGKERFSSRLSKLPPSLFIERMCQFAKTNGL